MSAALAFRTIVVATALISACSERLAEPSASVGDAGATTHAGSPSHSPSVGGAGAGGAGAQPGAGNAPSSSSAGLAELSQGGFDSSAGAAGTGATQHGSNIATAITWKIIAESADSSVSTGLPATASRGEDAAVAYIERSGTTTTATPRVVMQRFDATAERLGSLVVLGGDPVEQSNVTLASDGKQYAACWNAALEVHCSLIDQEGHVRLNALAVTGQYATIVGNASGWAIAYTGADKRLRLQALTSELELNGSVICPQLSGQFSSRDLGPLFATTPSGYVLVAGSSDEGEVGLMRLGTDLLPSAPALPLGRKLWYAGQLVASDTRAAVSLSAPYGSFLLLSENNRLTAELPVAGGGKTGMDHALVLTDGGIGAAWLDREGKGVVRRFMGDGHDSDIGGLETRDLTGSPLGLPEEGTDSYQQLVRVADQTLLVGKWRRYGSLANSNAIRVATLTFP